MVFKLLQTESSVVILITGFGRIEISKLSLTALHPPLLVLVSISLIFPASVSAGVRR